MLQEACSLLGTLDAWNEDPELGDDTFLLVSPSLIGPHGSLARGSHGGRPSKTLLHQLCATGPGHSEGPGDIVLDWVLLGGKHQALGLRKYSLN